MDRHGYIILVCALSRLRYQRSLSSYGTDSWRWYDGGMRTIEAMM
jgi:hypothetical protein